MTLIRTLRPAIQVQLTAADSVLKLPGAPANAGVSVDPTGTNNILIWRRMIPGVEGNNWSVIYIDPGANSAALSLTITAGYQIQVSLATNSGGTITTTAQDIMDAVAGDGRFNQEIRVFPGEALSTGLIAAVTSQAFTGGAAASGAFLFPFSHAEFQVNTNTAGAVRTTSDCSDPSTTVGLIWGNGVRISWLDGKIDYRKVLENIRVIRDGAVSADLAVAFFTL